MSVTSATPLPTSPTEGGRCRPSAGQGHAAGTTHTLPRSGEGWGGGGAKGTNATAGTLLLRGLIVPLLILLFAALPASAREEIRAFNLKLAVYQTGNVFANETITVNAEGNEIKHGLFRDIELASGETLEVLTVKRDGHDEPYTFAPNGDLKRLKIGDPNVLLDPGVHTYELSYVMRGVMSGNRLAWQATGTWSLPIVAAHASVLAPPGTIIKRAAGRISCTECNGKFVHYEVSAVRANFTALSEIVPGDGLVISLGFAKTPVKPPPVKLDQ